MDSGSRGKFSNTSFGRNYADSNGGGILLAINRWVSVSKGRKPSYLLLFSSATFVDCHFHDNLSGSKGGSIGMIDNTEAHFHSCRIERSQASGSGGSIYLDDGSKFFLLHSELLSGSALSRGGAIYAAGHCQLLVDYSLVDSNSASTGAGGAVLLQDSALAIFTNSVFSVRGITPL